MGKYVNEDLELTQQRGRREATEYFCKEQCGGVTVREEVINPP